MGKVVYLPGCKPKEPVLAKKDFEEYMIIEILKEISITFIDLRMEMGATAIWYESVNKFIQERDIPELASKYSIDSALRDFKKHWKNVILEMATVPKLT
jgi:hypothetical protein